jgi:hypothetical protein
MPRRFEKSLHASPFKSRPMWLTMILLSPIISKQDSKHMPIVLQAAWWLIPWKSLHSIVSCARVEKGSAFDGYNICDAG